MVGEQVVGSMEKYSVSNLKNLLSPEQLKSLTVSKLNKKGVQGQDNARAVEQNDIAIKKAERRKKDDKTIEDFKTEAANQTVDNDTDWVDFEQQQLNLRRKEVSKKGFWGSQAKEVLKRVYKGVFPGIADAVKDTKGALLDVIGAYLKEKDAADRINLQATVGLDGATNDSDAARRKDAMLGLFTNPDAHQEVSQHYLEYSGVVLDEDDVELDEDDEAE
jgi:hypothetical protein